MSKKIQCEVFSVIEAYDLIFPIKFALPFSRHIQVKKHTKVRAIVKICLKVESMLTVEVSPIDEHLVFLRFKLSH